MRILAPLLVLLLAPACDRRCGVEARPLTTAIAGDANSDGVVDIADGVAIHDLLFRRGHAPPCPAAADLLPDGVIDAADGTAVWYHLLFGNTQLYPLEEPCSAPEASTEPACGGELALRILAPASSSGPFAASIELVNPALEVRGWSISLRASGCTITDATTDNTDAADLRQSPPGQRDGGMAMKELVSGGLIAAAILDIPGDAAFAPSETARTLLRLDVRPDGGGPCTLALEDGLQGAGEPVANVIAAGGRSYSPATDSVSVSP